jgi:hypothetical protein
LSQKEILNIMPSRNNSQEGYIVSFRIDPNETAGTRGYVPIHPDAGQFYYGPVDDPDRWRPLGLCPTPEGKKFPKNQTFTVDLSSPDETMKLAWAVTYAPRPAEVYGKCNCSPFKDTTLRNADGQLVGAAATRDRNGDVHYTLTTEKMENGGRFLFAIYATIISGNGAGKAFAVDPEMEVSEI